jgi:hypothetical protein
MPETSENRGVWEVNDFSTAVIFGAESHAVFEVFFEGGSDKSTDISIFIETTYRPTIALSKVRKRRAVALHHENRSTYDKLYCMRFVELRFVNNAVCT